MIALCPNPFRDTDLVLTRECMRILCDIGREVCVCPVFTGEDAVLLNGCPANAKTQDTFFSEFLTSADTGGDTLVPSDIGKKLALLRGKKR